MVRNGPGAPRADPGATVCGAAGLRLQWLKGRRPGGGARQGILAPSGRHGRDEGGEASMALSLTCACGARFEVEDTLAGQEVSCPECQQPLKAPALQRVPLRTSGFALASAQLA